MNEVVEKDNDRLDRIWIVVNEQMDECSNPQKIKELLGELTDVFALDDSELGCTKVIKHTIDTCNHPPIKQPSYRITVARRLQIATMVKDMQENGIVHLSVSPWAGPVVLVSKKDGSLLFCINYRKLNSESRKDIYPLLCADDVLDTLGRMRYFSSLDLASGFWTRHRGIGRWHLIEKLVQRQH